MTDLYIGMDGGGTRTTAVLVRSDGRILRRAEGRGMNWLNDGLEACTERFRDLIRQLLPGDPGVTVKVCAGCAALDGPAPDGILDAFRAVLPPGTRLMLTSDLSAARAGLTRGRPGLMAVCGTGSMVLIRNRKGEEKAAGGWGRRIGDPGSGAMLAREALFTGLYLAETEGKRVPLLEAALRFFGGSRPRDLPEAVHAPGLGQDAIAAFGREVILLAENGDPEARSILERQMSLLAGPAAFLLEEAPEAKESIGVYGGVFQHSALARKLFSEALGARIPGLRIRLPQDPSAQGAVLLGMLEDGLQTEELPDMKEEKP